jgi:hypothetical protein
MADPPAFGQPDRMQSILYESGADDQGGVHTNSGVGNKAAFLLTDGGTFNGHTVGAIGLEKTARIFYVVETTLLTSGSDYADLADDLQQACTASIGTAGITSGDCAQVAEAVAATEMSLQPVTGAAVPDAPVCPAGATPVDLFFDDFDGTTAGPLASPGSNAGLNDEYTKAIRSSSADPHRRIRRHDRRRASRRAGVPALRTRVLVRVSDTTAASREQRTACDQQTASGCPSTTLHRRWWAKFPGRLASRA